MKKFLLLLVVAAPLTAQVHYPKHYVSIGGGTGVPGGEAAGLNNSGGITLSYGYRFKRNFQADIALDTVFGAARLRQIFDTDIGTTRTRDFQYFFPLGGRAVLPLRNGRVILSVGGGGAYLRYSERLKQISSYYRLQCFDCAKRSGWGNYALAGASFAIDRYQMFRFGLTAKMYRAHTDGAAFGAVPPVETLDRWLNLFADITISF
jgi:hypothetical protein